MNRPALTLLGAGLAFIAAGADTALARQTRDPDAYLRTLAAISPQAAHSARASCLSRRSGSQDAYNQCLRAAFLAAGGPASAPVVPNLTTRPEARLSLEPLAGPPPATSMGQAARQAPQDCPPLTECAVVIGAFTSAAIAQRELEMTASRFPELREPFNTSIRPVTAPNGTQTYQTAFINGTRAEAHALCDAIKVAGRTCVVARQVPARSPASDIGAFASPSRNNASDSSTPFGEQAQSSHTGGSAGVQIGAFSSTAIADREYAAVASRFGQYAWGAEKRVQEVTAASGSTVYRTTFSGMSRDRAVAFCDALKAAGRDCVVR